MLQSITKSKLYLIILLFIFAGSIFISLKHAPLVDDLDPSWQFSINYAVTNHLNFGRDIIFTYGPLGFISYNIAAGLSNGLIIISWIIRAIFLTYFIAVLYEFAVSLSVNISKNISLLVKYILLPYMVYKVGQIDYSIIIFVCLVHCCIINVIQTSGFFLADFFNKRKHWLNLFAGFTISLLFFIKVSFLPFILMIPIAIVAAQLIRKEYKNLIAFVGTLILTFVVIYAFGNVDLKNYILNSLQIILGYKWAMQIAIYDAYHASYRLSAFLIGLYLVQLYFIRKSFKGFNTVLLLLLLLSLYWIFSYSYTRGVEGGLVYGCPIIVIFFYMVTYAIHDEKWKIRIYDIIGLTLFVCLMTFGTADFWYLVNYGLKPAKPPMATLIPKQDLIAAQSYDVYPWNTSYCYFNHLNYKPRPIIQTYSCYTAKLDTINASFFAARKVDHIIFHGSTTNVPGTNTIDDRYFMYDEPQTKLEILKNYAVDHQINDSLFIASKRADVIKTHLKLIRSFDFKLDREYNIEPDSDKSRLYYFTADLKYTTATNVLSLIKRYPYIKVDILLRSGKMMTFNLVSDLLSHPCVLNKYCASYNDFFKLVNGDNVAANDIKSLKFYSSAPGGYQPGFAMKIYKLEIL